MAIFSAHVRTPAIGFLAVILVVPFAPLAAADSGSWTKAVKNKIHGDWMTPRPRCLGHCHKKFWQNARFKFDWIHSDDFFKYRGYPNAKKWFVHDPHRCIGPWDGRSPGLFLKKNVWVQKQRKGFYGGLLISANAYPNGTHQANEYFDKHIECRMAKHNTSMLREAKYHTYTTGMVSSVDTVLYGYFEVHAKTMQTQLVNSFWFSEVNGNVHEEIDVFESSHVNREDYPWGLDKKYWTFPNAISSVFIGHQRHWLKKIARGKHRANEPISKKLRTHGLLWTEKKITWFFDGKPYMTVNNTHWHRPLKIRFDVETNEKWLGVMPDVVDMKNDKYQFILQYFRAWKVKGETGLPKEV